MHFRKYSAVAVIMFAIAACSKQAITKMADANGSKDGLTGTWQWVRTDGGIGYNIHQTPLSTGKQVLLKLAADSTYTIYTNNVVTSQGTYTIEIKTCIHDQTTKPFLHFSKDLGLMVERQTHDSLVLSDEYMDGVESKYARAVNEIK